MIGEGLFSNVLLLIVVFAVATIAFVRALFYWKRGNGAKDRILMLVLFAVSAYATVSFWLFVADMIS
ncbi:MAG: hypothetical protein QF661_00415 [Arenicellales bacterium]|nr:hypothetical protein [Arenicellales bacterium]MEC7791384.1 hypothetical protein [Pseudomonadota bacterium]MDP6266185.1 hypothetical protein [Arenicellales bacterium]MDP7450707.1 hypothetical protein [Arenicellales bacterium]MDP7616003.1 hypothetical protein [Arenicellales bacterium]|tara:strand:- start:275 stop:475 length:201 start_codon:yes stop_codon:yes gene_type:complete